MQERIKKSKEDSDTSYFYDLMLLGELFIKFTVSCLIAGIQDDKDRNRYRLIHRIVRADGIGEWSSVLDEILIGVPSQILQGTITVNEQKELLVKCDSGAWQYKSIQSLINIFPIVQLEEINMPVKTVGRQWFSYFAQLRNGTKAHGALTASQCSMACQYLSDSLSIVIENFSMFRREFAYLYLNMNGRYRVTKLNESISNFEELKFSNRYSSLFQNGLYVYFDRITHIELINSTPEAYGVPQC